MTNKIRKVLGLPQKITGFLDGVERKAYPVTMRDFPEFMEALQRITSKALWYNFTDEASVKAVKVLLELSFKENSYDELASNINADNWNQIASSILEMNGLYKAAEGSDNRGKISEE